MFLNSLFLLLFFSFIYKVGYGVFRFTSSFNRCIESFSFVVLFFFKYRFQVECICIYLLFILNAIRQDHFYSNVHKCKQLPLFSTCTTLTGYMSLGRAQQCVGTMACNLLPSSDFRQWHGSLWFCLIAILSLDGVPGFSSRTWISRKIICKYLGFSPPCSCTQHN